MAFDTASSALVSFFPKRSSLIETGWTTNSLCDSFQGCIQVSNSFHLDLECLHLHSHSLMEWSLIYPPESSVMRIKLVGDST